MGNARVLIVDDVEQIREMLVSCLKSFGYTAKSTESGEAALEELTKEDFDIVILDVIMPNMNGLEVLKRIKSKYPSIQVIMLTGQGSFSSVVECVKSGAYDYVSKPVMINDIVAVIERAYREKSKDTSEFLVLSPGEGFKHGAYFGNTKKVKEILSVIESVAPTDSTVLICGETGTGKELIAKAIHAKSKRKDKPFIILNCAALQESLIESEFFGHEKGAFTGAAGEKKGIVEVAHTGTLFLDEVGELTMNLQTRLLRLLEQGEYRRVGGTETLKTDIRVIAATNRELLKEIENGRFRKDLYYRLNIVQIEPPPLRERKSDLPYLMLIMIKRFNAAFSKEITSVSGEVMDIFGKYEWPGNIRELENVMQSAILLAKTKTITIHDLPGKLREFSGEKDTSSLRQLSEIEKEYILEVLRSTEGNKLKAAKVLGIDRTTLYKKLAEYGIK